MKRRILFIFLGFFLLLSFVYSQNVRRKASEKKQSATVKKGSLENRLTLSGEIEATEKATLAFQSSGKLSYVGVKEGDRVEKGQVIASLDIRSVKKNLQKELNDFAKNRNELDQTRDDYKGIAMTDKIKRTLENVQYDVNNAVIDVELQDLSRQLATITTPISGIITVANPSQSGVNVTPTSVSYQIINPQSIYFSASVDQTDIAKIREKMAGEIVIDAFPDQKFKGKINTISLVPKEGETGAVYTVKTEFNKLPSNIVFRLGMSGDINLVIQKKENVLFIPIIYVKENDNGDKYVFIFDKGKKIKRTVQTGIETDEFIEVKNGLSEGERVYD